MAKVLKTVRVHWKKSLVGAGVVAYGLNYGKTQLENGDVMRAKCETANIFGEVPARPNEKIRRITVILNPAANKRSAKKNFDKYCAPLLHLSGMFINVIETEREGHARELIDKIDPNTDGIVVAGGDGTLSETITGIMRTKGELCDIPIGVLPLGKTNTLAQRIFGPVNDDNRVLQMANATMAVVKGNTKSVNAMKVQVLESEHKPVYGVGGIEWGIWNEMKKRQQKMWYFGPFRDYCSLLFPGNALQREVVATVRYTKPCSGCSRCYTLRPDIAPKAKPVQGSAWWNIVSLTNRRKQLGNEKPQVDYKNIINESCGDVEEKSIDASDIQLLTESSFKETEGTPQLLLNIGPKIKYPGTLLSNGIKHIQGEDIVVDSVALKEVEILPKAVEDSLEKSESLAIDSEDYEVKPIKVTLLPNSVKVFV